VPVVRSFSSEGRAVGAGNRDRRYSIRPSGTAAASPHPASAPAVPDLPPKLEQFQALVRLAFAALRPNPEDEAPAAMLDTFAANLWARLRVFEAVVELEEERFDAAMEGVGEEPPRDGQDIMDRCYYIAMQLAEDRDLEGMLKGYLRTIHSNAGVFLRERYGPSPEFDRFFGQ